LAALVRRYLAEVDAFNKSSAANLHRVYEQDLKPFALIQMNMGREVCRRLREADNRLFRARMGTPDPDIENVFLGG
jgi:CRP/FNR family transcriptional regulator, cyclic AMP receptor protein